jgi:hypothetical protein
MAMCTPDSVCPICNAELGEKTQLIGFPDLILLTTSPWGDFYDTCAHLSCINGWEHRDEFIAFFNKCADGETKGPRYRMRVSPNGVVELRQWKR